MDEKISKLFLPLLDKLYNTEPAGEPFRKPVDVVKYGCYDYYYYVKHPIDLSTIRERLTSHQYKDAWRFVADIQLMFSNAYLFNKKGTPVWEFTNKLSKIWNAELTPIMQRLNYCCGTLQKFGPQLLFCHGTTPDRYCQIAIGAKYKCYQDQYSFCIPCFNKIDSESVSIQGLSCETIRMKLPTKPVKKSDFKDCTNDNWQYESFIQCTQCSKRVHQICELYPANEDEIKACIQHTQIEHEQEMLCQVPEEYRIKTEEADPKDNLTETISSNTTDEEIQSESNTIELSGTDSSSEPSICVHQDQEHDKHESDVMQGSLDDELVQLARDVEENSHLTSWAPQSPNHQEDRLRSDSAKNAPQKSTTTSSASVSKAPNGSVQRAVASANTSHNASGSLKNSVDNIAARLSSNKMGCESHSEDIKKPTRATIPLIRDKFVCNHCYRKRKLGYNLRHRKYSARRLPHTRMSRYIETKVNEHIRENSPTAGEVTIRVLTAYRDIVEVKQDMRDYIRRMRGKDMSQHPFLRDYPDNFGYTNRAIFAWQEIDGVDVCVFGMHVQEYGDDCPEPNRQVIYLSYIDSVHFFRPKQFRTAVYHEILLSYFKYVKKLGFRRVFIWVCPSRKGDDYIFYRHPTEQKMPTLKRLSDWYVNLLDKGIISGIVERHQSIYQFASSQRENSISLLDLPYLSGDYWPGEFERLLKIMIESQKEYEAKIQTKRGTETSRDATLASNHNSMFNNDRFLDTEAELAHGRHNMLSLSSLYQRAPTNQVNNKAFSKNTFGQSSSRPSRATNSVCFTPDGDYSLSMSEDSKQFDPFTPDSIKSEDQPLDLSKSSSNASPESYLDDDFMSEMSFQSSTGRKKKRKSTSTMGYTKKRSRNHLSTQASGTRTNASEGSKFMSQPVKKKSSNQSHKDQQGSEILLDPEEELMKNIERSLKRQRDGFIVARLNDCDCSPHFESQRRKEEVTFTCDLMKGREPFLQLARLQNYEFSTLRRAKFSSLAMVKHLGQYFKLEPICNECFSFDSSKRHYACSHCEDFYLCTSCHENTHHDHIMSLMIPTVLPDINEFLPQCSLASTTNSISSASSTISNKSFTESNNEISTQSASQPLRKDSLSSSTSTPLNHHLSNTTYTGSMPLGCHRQKNFSDIVSNSQVEDVENADIRFGNNVKLSLNDQPTPPPSHSANNIRDLGPTDLDRALTENFLRHAEVSYDIDFDQMKSESQKLLSHYFACPSRETCHRCRFIVLSCSFMSVLMKSSRLQMMINCPPGESLSTSNSNNNHISGINLTTNTHRLHSYQPKDK